MKILVADDSQTNLALTASALTRLGHSVLLAKSGQEAIDHFKANRPDLIILDVMMEGMDGFECARKIREIDSDDWIPIIFLSGSVDDESIAKGIDAGGDDYLTKPFSEITLAAKIRAMQRISDMRQKLFETTQNLYLLSSTDSLTGIYNRLQFERSIKEILTTADRHQHQVALLFIDIDNFKNINDSFGHHAGDLFLVEIAARLKSCLRANDFLARIGGDEFSIVVSEIRHVDEVNELCKKILSKLIDEFQLDGHQVKSGASIGVAFYPKSGNQENLIRNADIAMYHAKALGRNNFQIFSEDLNKKYRQKISIEHALRFALERNEFKMTYQPIFNLLTQTISGVEALITWEHPTYGTVSPSVFIPIAEETGLIHYIGDWVVKMSCQHAATWPMDKFEDFRFAINISSQQITQPNFYQSFVDAVTEHKLSPNHLSIELTETAFMSQFNDEFRNVIEKFDHLGIHISIDDFGTGYSSLIRLKHLPVSTLKIDKQFVQDAVVDPNGAIIVKCLIALGNNLGLNVIAEGIETKEQLNFLINHGCQQGQGFYLSMPLPPDQIAKLLKEKALKKVK